MRGDLLADTGEVGGDIVVVVVEYEGLIRQQLTGSGDDRVEQLFLVLEVDVERALRHARDAGDFGHAAGIEALGKDLATRP